MHWIFNCDFRLHREEDSAIVEDSGSTAPNMVTGIYVTAKDPIKIGEVNIYTHIGMYLQNYFLRSCSMKLDRNQD